MINSDSNRQPLGITMAVLGLALALAAWAIHVWLQTARFRLAKGLYYACLLLVPRHVEFAYPVIHRVMFATPLAFILAGGILTALGLRRFVSRTGALTGPRTRGEGSRA